MERRTLFQNGFRREPWSPTLGQFDWASLITGLVTGGVQAYGQYQAAERAEEQREAEEARAAAARAAAEAARAQAAIAAEEQKRREALTQQLEARGIEQAPLLGIPTPYLLIGGAALAAVAIVFAVTR